ncbi:MULTISPECIES: CDP-diacylglycerol--serine O-phosphatidyltransferase [unclassified Gemella]|uniref:CDP-diacylglycerol--serine O-phosphatidyltransferase n=1 Tax=unclassified Gemella TaxID=2624949 RepID=UPI001C05C0A7|nr:MULTISPECIES: CDP-diacylglycerol--serine O-phosphatidyltransferase [unclassified Gemella]MBU0279358.1 CDP-diacylglycerol--serine O-phosphatidyltransferase [Gemella sp. zg-1178]QWQ38909.1 CDP-diacylglycerol--serine O-phosphatidyltransferase [Gemella sp. zg-570]
MNKEIIPNAITMANGLCGFLSIILTSTGQYTYASVFIILSMFADRYDGMVARKLGVVSPLGKELDSICDVISFGVAPAFLVFFKIHTASNLLLVSIIATIICSVYVCCGAFRLARFNVTTMTDGYYQGVPITTCGLLLAFLSFNFIKMPNIALLILTAIFGYFMVSKIKIKKI